MNARLYLFTVVSLLAHAGLMLTGDNNKPSILNIGGHARTLQVSIQPGTTVDAESPPAAGHAQTKTQTPAKHQPPQPRQPVRRKIVAHGPQSVQTEARPALPATTSRQPLSTRQELQDAAATASKAIENSKKPSRSTARRVSAALRQELATYFSYPGMARKRGWQGEVTLSLLVERNGTLSEVTVARSSGHPVLDRSALRSALRIKQLPGISKQLGSEPLSLQIPVKFQLLDS